MLWLIALTGWLLAIVFIARFVHVSTREPMPQPESKTDREKVRTR